MACYNFTLKKKPEGTNQIFRRRDICSELCNRKQQICVEMQNVVEATECTQPGWWHKWLINICNRTVVGVLAFHLETGQCLLLLPTTLHFKCKSSFEGCPENIEIWAN